MFRKLALALVYSLLIGGARPSMAKSRPPEPGGGEIIYGQDFAIVLSPPPGWVMNTGASAQPINAAFYPKGSSFDKGICVMYATVSGKGQGEGATIAAFIREDIARQKHNSPGLKVKDAPPLPTSGKRKAVVKLFSGDARLNWEAAAYIDEKTSIVVLVLTSRDKKHFDAALPAFRRLVASYLWVTDKVQVSLPTGQVKNAPRPKARPGKTK